MGIQQGYIIWKRVALLAETKVKEFLLLLKEKTSNNQFIRREKKSRCQDLERT
jgi:hypothetical protein